MGQPIVVGAVLYDPRVSVIWDLIRDFFEEQACAIDAVFYTNYELMVRALVQGHVDIAWNSPLGWLDAERQLGGACRAIAMRDTDRDRVSHIIAKAQDGIATVGGDRQLLLQDRSRRLGDRCLVGPHRIALHHHRAAHTHLDRRPLPLTALLLLLTPIHIRGLPRIHRQRVVPRGQTRIIRVGSAPAVLVAPVLGQRLKRQCRVQRAHAGPPSGS